MSFPAPALDRVLEELQIKIYKKLNDQDVLSLAVVSKEVSRNALPLLYLTSVLTIPREEEPTPDIWGYCWSRKQQNRYCKTLKKHPELGERARSLYLTISQEDCGFADDESEEEDTATINQVVGALSKLQQLVTLQVFQNMNVDLPDSILSALPPSLAIVNLEHSALSEQACLALLRRLPLLEHFEVYISEDETTEESLPLHHSKLAHLTLNLPAVSPSFFLAVTYDTPNLTSFESDFEGLIKMKGSPVLQQLEKLRVLGQRKYFSLDQRQLVLDLATILDECTSLVSLTVQPEMQSGIASKVLVAIEEHDIFRHIPPSLTSLDICGSLFHPSYILATVQRLATQLNHLITSTIRNPGDGGFRAPRTSPRDEASERRLQELCHANEISWKKNVEG